MKTNKQKGQENQRFQRNFKNAIYRGGYHSFFYESESNRMCLKQQRGAMPYDDRLKAHNWINLTNRRQQHVVTFTIKSLYGLIDCHSINSNTIINARHQDVITFNHHYARTLALKNSPIHPFPPIWSSLPTHIKDSLVLDSLQCFCKYLFSYFHD